MIPNSAKASIPATDPKLIMTALVPLLVWGTQPAQAQLACGDTVPPGDHVSLGSDIGPCPEPGPALILVGPVNVNLNGFTVSCSAAITGIEVQGIDARVRNGVVEDCEDAVVVDGEGQHKLLQLTVRSTQDQIGDRGFRVRSDGNRLINNRAVEFNGEGFRIEGDDNRLIVNRATANANHGFRVDESNNRLVSNRARGNAGEGFRLDGDGNRLTNNAAVNNDDEGFRIRDGQNNTLINNRARENGITDNEAGIRIQGDGNTLRTNTFVDSFGDGVLVVEGAENNTIMLNVAVDNEGTDLVDQNLDCDGNRWSKNVFQTASQDCIE